VHALEDVSFRILEGEVLGVVGATGSGKSTIARVLTGLVTPQAGTVTFDEGPLDFVSRPQLRRRVQMIFQDPYSALYPHWTVRAYLREAIRHHRLVQQEREDETMVMALESVGLQKGFLERYPGQLSGGERQRVQIARALIIKPVLLICDEVTSGLDISVQRQILDLLIALHREHAMAVLFISHDLHVIRQIAHRVLVLADGTVVEEARTELLFANPQHKVTRDLINQLSR
jgi:peptide/nickel transport system ATP-binding protein